MSRCDLPLFAYDSKGCNIIRPLVECKALKYHFAAVKISPPPPPPPKQKKEKSKLPLMITPIENQHLPDISYIV